MVPTSLLWLMGINTNPQQNPTGKGEAVEDTNSPVLQLPWIAVPQIASTVSCANSELLEVFS